MSITRTRTAGIGLATIVIGSHLVLPLAPHVPTLSMSSEDGHLSHLSSTVTQLWVIEATLLGALLVALFFGLSAVRDSDPPRATLDRLLVDIGFEWVLALLTSALVGSGITALMLLSPGWEWPIKSPSLGALPLLDFVFFGAGIGAFVFLIVKAAGYLYPAAVLRLTVEQAAMLSRVVSRDERKRWQDRLHGWDGTFGRQPAKPRPLPSPPKERRDLIGLFAEVQDRAIRAVELDDLPRLREMLGVLRTILSAHFSEWESPESARKDHETPLDDHPPLWQSIESLTMDRVEVGLCDLVELAISRPGSGCTPSLLWFPFLVWNLGLDQDFHRMSRFGLELASRTYLQLLRAKDKTLVEQWVTMWRRPPNGPEEFLMHQVRLGIREEDTKEEDVHHLLLAGHEVRLCLSRAMSTALLAGDASTCLDLLGSRSTVINIFWPIRDPHFSYPDSVRQRLREIELASAEGMAILIGLAAVVFHERGEMAPVLKAMLRIAREEDFKSVERVSEVLDSRIRKWFTPEWFSSVLSADDEVLIHTGQSLFDVSEDFSEEELAARAFVLLVSDFAKESEGQGHLDLLSLIQGRPELLAVVEQMTDGSRDWGDFLPSGFDGMGMTVAPSPPKRRRRGGKRAG